MQKRVIIILFSILFITSMSQSVRAQDQRRIFTDFQNLELYIKRVAELVQRFNDPQANNYINQAMDELELARTNLFEIKPARYALALIQMGRARRLAELAARFVLRKPFANLKSQLDDLIDRAERSVSNVNSDEAYYLLNQAKKFRRRAYDSFLNNELAKGQEYYRIAFFFARKCIDFLSNQGRNIIEQINDLELSIRQLLMQVDELLSTNTQEGLRKLYDDAQQYFEEAMLLVDEAKYPLALKRLRLIERLLYRIYDLLDRDQAEPEVRLENSLYSLKAFLDALQEEVRTVENPQIETMFDKCSQLFEEAQREFEAKNYDQTQMKISLSQRLANRVYSMTRDRDTFDLTELKNQLSQTRELLTMQETQIESSENKNLKLLYQEASNILDRADQELTNGRLNIAFQLIKTATRISARIQKEIRKESAVPGENVLREKYQRIQYLLTQMQNNAEVVEKYGHLLSQLAQLAARGKQIFDENNYILADEYFSMVLEQIRIYTDKWRK